MTARALNVDALAAVNSAKIAARAERALLPEREAWEILGRHVPATLPVGWESVSVGEDGAMYRNRRTEQTVIISVAREDDGRRWLHVSTAFPTRLPTYAELAEVKRLWIGAEYRAHVNIHRFALHLWHCVDGDGLPDFTGGTGSV